MINLNPIDLTRTFSPEEVCELIDDMEATAKADKERIIIWAHVLGVIMGIIMGVGVTLFWLSLL